MNIVFLDEYSLGGIDLSRIKQLGNYTGYEKTTPGEIAERCIDADIVITNKVPLRAEAIKVLPQLKLICIAATGMNNVDLEAAAERGIEVRNAVGYSTKQLSMHIYCNALCILPYVPPPILDKYICLTYHVLYYIREFFSSDTPLL